MFEILSSDSAFYVVKVPREYPSSLMKGDFLTSCYLLAREIRERAKIHDDKQLSDLAEHLKRYLEIPLQVYEDALIKHQIELPRGERVTPES